MPERKFEPVVLPEPKETRLRPLFVGRIANALDFVADLGSTLFGLLLVVGGIGVFAHNMYSVVLYMASRGAWLPLGLLGIGCLALALYFWRSSLIARLILVCVLSVASFVASPILERVLT